MFGLLWEVNLSRWPFKNSSIWSHWLASIFCCNCSFHFEFKFSFWLFSAKCIFRFHLKFFCLQKFIYIFDADNEHSRANRFTKLVLKTRAIRAWINHNNHGFTNSMLIWITLTKIDSLNLLFFKKWLIPDVFLFIFVLSIKMIVYM